MGTTHLGAPGPPGAPWWVVVPTWAPHLSFIPLHHLPLEKITIALSLSLSLVLLSNPQISIFLLEAPFLKLLWGIATWYVTPPFLQLVFALVYCILNN